MKANRNEIYGSFMIGENEFAISVNFVNEVVVSPASYIKLPLAPEYLLGLFNLRGMIIPVVDINAILKITNKTTDNLGKKIAIIEFDNFKIGLLFDKVGEIFKSLDEEKNEFDGNYEKGIISGVFRKDQGQRIIQILDVVELLKLKDIQLYNKEKDFSKNNIKQSRRGLRKQCITFGVGNSLFSFEINSIQEILKLSKLSSTVKTNKHSLGFVNIRGATVPVVDLASLLGFSSEESLQDPMNEGEKRIVVIKVGQEKFGLLVSSVNSILSFYSDELKPFPTLSSFKTNLYLGCISYHDMEILLLDSNYLFSESEIIELTHGHSKLFRESERNQLSKEKNSKKSTYISFCVDALFAISIKDVKEIIDEPSVYIKAPNLPDFYKGVLNLRGELVFIVDPLSLYAKGSEKKALGKILILNYEDKKIGILVESVESILSLSEENKLPIPSMMLTQKNKLGIAADVKEILTYSKEGADRTDLLLIDAKSIINKIFNVAS